MVVDGDGFEGCSVVPVGTQWDNVDSGRDVKTRLFMLVSFKKKERRILFISSE